MKVTNHIFKEKSLPEAFKQNPAYPWNDPVYFDTRTFTYIINRSDMHIPHAKIMLVQFNQQIIWHAIVAIREMAVYPLCESAMCQ